MSSNRQHHAGGRARLRSQHAAAPRASEEAVARAAGGGRQRGLDALKGLAIIAVVAIHLMLGGVRGVPEKPFAVGITVLFMAVPVFMIVSALFVARELAAARHGAVARRLLRLVPVYLVWTAVFVVAAVVDGGSVLQAVRSHGPVDVVVFGGAWYHLYFLPALIQLLLVMPFLDATVSTRRRATVAVAASAVFLAGAPLLTGVWRPANGTVAHDVVLAAYDAKYVFVWVPAGLVAAALARGTLSIRPRWWLLAGAVLFTFERAVAVAGGSPWPASYAKAGLLVASAGAVAAAATWTRPPATLERLGRLSLGVFLVHPLVVRVVQLGLGTSVSVWQLGPLLVVVVAVSAAIVAVALRTPARALFDGRLWPPLPRLAPGTPARRPVTPPV